MWDCSHNYEHILSVFLPDMQMWLCQMMCEVASSMFTLPMLNAIHCRLEGACVDSQSQAWILNVDVCTCIPAACMRICQYLCGCVSEWLDGGQSP